MFYWTTMKFIANHFLIILSIAYSVQAFYAFEQLKIDSAELDSNEPCKIVTSESLIAYQCAEYFKIFLVTSRHETPSIVYSTTKAVEQIRPSKLDSDPFISFIEASLESQSVPSAYAYLKVVDSSGERDIGATSKFFPNRSVYLGGNLVIKINESETYLQVYDVTAGLTSSLTIKILENGLQYDYYPQDGGVEDQWIISVCLREPQTSSIQFYAADGRNVTPQLKTIYSDYCVSRLQLDFPYMMLSCASENHVTLWKLDSDYIMTAVTRVSDITNPDKAVIQQFDDTQTIIYYEKSSDWTQGQTDEFNYIETTLILRLNSLSQPVVITQKQDLFYEMHAQESTVFSFQDHIVNQHQISGLEANYGTIAGFTITGQEITLLTKEQQQGGSNLFKMHKMNQCGLNSINVVNVSGQSESGLKCLQPELNKYLDWIKMESHGMIETSSCETSQEDLSDFQKILQVYNCDDQSDIDLQELQTFQFTLEKKNLELDGVSCSLSEQKVIGGHCVNCGSPLCIQCYIENTDGIIYGFYLNNEVLDGTCIECGPNAILDAQTGVCSCQDKYFFNEQTKTCSQCSDNCLQCDQVEKCTQCEADYIIGTEGNCISTVCEDSEYFNTQLYQCQDCHSSCATCSEDGAKCESCPDGLQIGETICLECNVNEIIEGDECVPCSAGCLDCSSSNTCLVCEANAELDLKDQCLCKDGFFMNSENKCQPCNPTCETCSSTDVCETCPLGFEPADTICLSCANDEFIQGDVCINCGKNCQECSSGPNQCQTCNVLSDLQSDGTCLCSDGFYQDSDSQNCVSCHESCKTCDGDTSCSTCEEGFSLGDSICLACSDDEFIQGDECFNCGSNCLSCDTGPGQCKACKESFDLSNGICICEDGFFHDQSSNQCTNCNETCETCLSAASCETCPIGFILADTICLSCDNNEYIQGDACVNCGQNCLECNSGPNECQECRNSFDLQPDGTCLCSPGFYQDSNGENCLTCHESCKTCDGDSSCSTCEDGFSLGDSICLKCSKNEFINGDECVNCGSNCLSCDTGPNQCKTCKETFGLKNGLCVCEDGFFYDQNIEQCQACNPTCETCISTDVCETCPFGFELADTICLSCANDEFIQGDACINCGLNCQECSSGPNQCQICIGQTELQSDGTCLCSAGFYQDSDSQNCVSCHESCKTCDRNSSCSTCEEGFLLADTICLSCANDEFIQGDICLSCGQNCLSCDTGPGQCKACNESFDLQNGLCVCEDGFFHDSNSNLCVNCNETCETCLSNYSCETCPEGFELADTICLACENDEFQQGDQCKKCGNDCLECNSGPNQCSQCNSNSMLSNGECQCNDGYFMDFDQNSCLKCGSTCETCQDSQQCLTCPQGSILGQTLCLSCGSAEYISADECQACGQNCVKCDSGPNQCTQCSDNSLLNDGLCEQQCTDGFYLDLQDLQCKQCESSCLTCKDSLSCETCEGNYELQNGSCLCKDGFFMNSENKCQPCNPTCETCLSIDVCQTCPLGFEPADTICLSCANDEFIQGDSCINCGENCQECSSGPNQCQICSDQTELQSDGTCLCSDGFYQDSVSQNCLSCHESCKTCDGDSSCSTCEEGFLLGDSICLSCKTNEYVFEDKCLQCQQNCLECSEQNLCNLCNEDFFLTTDNQCQCKDGFYSDQETSICLPCDSDCETCSNQGSCQSCPNGTQLGDSNKCVTCGSSQYMKEDQCISCSSQIPFCDQCSKQDGEFDSKNLVCQLCMDSFSLSQSNECECTDSFYFDESNQLCKACPSNCATCSSYDSCDSCLGTENILIVDQCVPIICQDGTYRDQTTYECNNCDQDCATCKTEADNCTTCKNDNTLVKTEKGTGNCLNCELGIDLQNDQACRCSNGNYFSLQSKQCLQCTNSKCKTCDSDGRLCLSCNQNFDLEPIKGICECPIDLGFYESQSQCLRCPENCESCTDGSSCNEFNLDLVVEFPTVDESSESTEIEVNIQSCPANCLSCDNITGRCFECFGTFKLREDTGICACPSGTFYDEQLFECSACILNCEACPDRKQCFTCAKNFQLDFDGQVCTVVFNQEIIDSGTVSEVETVTKDAQTEDNNTQILIIVIIIATALIIIALALVVYACICNRRLKQSKVQIAAQEDYESKFQSQREVDQLSSSRSKASEFNIINHKEKVGMHRRSRTSLSGIEPKTKTLETENQLFDARSTMNDFKTENDFQLVEGGKVINMPAKYQSGESSQTNLLLLESEDRKLNVIDEENLNYDSQEEHVQNISLTSSRSQAEPNSSRPSFSHRMEDEYNYMQDDDNMEATLVQKSLMILKEYDIKPTSQILEQVNSLQKQSSSNDQFLEQLIRLLVKMISSKARNSEKLSETGSDGLSVLRDNGTNEVTVSQLVEQDQNTFVTIITEDKEEQQIQREQTQIISLYSKNLTQNNQEQIKTIEQNVEQRISQMGERSANFTSQKSFKIWMKEQQTDISYHDTDIKKFEKTYNHKSNTDKMFESPRKKFIDSRQKNEKINIKNLIKENFSDSDTDRHTVLNGSQQDLDDKQNDEGKEMSKEQDQLQIKNLTEIINENDALKKKQQIKDGRQSLKFLKNVLKSELLQQKIQDKQEEQTQIQEQEQTQILEQQSARSKEDKTLSINLDVEVQSRRHSSVGSQQSVHLNKESYLQSNLPISISKESFSEQQNSQQNIDYSKLLTRLKEKNIKVEANPRLESCTKTYDPAMNDQHSNANFNDSHDYTYEQQEKIKSDNNEPHIEYETDLEQTLNEEETKLHIFDKRSQDDYEQQENSQRINNTEPEISSQRKQIQPSDKVQAIWDAYASQPTRIRPIPSNTFKTVETPTKQSRAASQEHEDGLSARRIFSIQHSQQAYFQPKISKTSQKKTSTSHGKRNTGPSDQKVVFMIPVQPSKKKNSITNITSINTQGNVIDSSRNAVEHSASDADRQKRAKLKQIKMEANRPKMRTHLKGKTNYALLQKSSKVPGAMSPQILMVGDISNQKLPSGTKNQADP